MEHRRDINENKFVNCSFSPKIVEWNAWRDGSEETTHTRSYFRASHKMEDNWYIYTASDDVKN